MPRRPRHPGGERGAADAVADGVHLVRAAEFACDLHDGADAFGEVVVEAHVAHRGIRVLPARDVDVQALVEQVAHHALLRVEVEDVELVDPRRDDDHRLGMHLRLRGRVVDDLEQAVAEDHRAGRGGEVAADLEAIRVGHAHVAGLQVGEHVAPALHQALAAAVDELPQRERVGQQVVGGRHRVEPLAPPEGGAPALLARQPRSVVEHVLHVVGEGEVPLLDQVPGGGLGPHRIGEARVVGIGLDRVGAGQADGTPPGVPLQFPQRAAEAGDAFAELLRVHQPGHLGVQDGRGDAVGVGVCGEPVADRGDAAVEGAPVRHAVVAARALGGAAVCGEGRGRSGVGPFPASLRSVHDESPPYVPSAPGLRPEPEVLMASMLLRR